MMDTVQNNEKLSVAALMSVILRRKISRTIDIKWLVEDEKYARKIIALCREQGLDDLNEYSAHFETLMFGGAAKPVPALLKASVMEDESSDTTIGSTTMSSTTMDMAMAFEPADSDEMPDPSKYIGGLR